VAGWIFDGYRGAGIDNSWVIAKGANLGEYVEKIRSMTLMNKHGDVINLNIAELKSLPAEVVQQIQGVVDPSVFEQLKNLQAPLVQYNMTIAYTIVFAFCAVAYLLAWMIMHFLVPKFKKIEL
jgi:MFS transporter, ACS family, hexuronate transporter